MAKIVSINLPFGISFKWEFVYQAYDKHSDFTKLFLKNKGKVFKNRFESNEAQIVYLPKLAKKLYDKHIMHYYYPDKNSFSRTHYKEINWNTFLLDNIVDDNNTDRKPSLFFYLNQEENGNYLFFVYELSDNFTNEGPIIVEQALECFRSFTRKEKEEQPQSGIMFRKVAKDIPKSADETFDYEVLALLDDVKRKINKLKHYGIGEAAILQMIHKKPDLSRLLITKKNDIILLDYDKKKIKMEPLPKAVFLLFLRHPEGIPFKMLSDYREELISIYEGLTSKRKACDMRNSINELVNPTKNHINEKCARIREAFLLNICDEIAKNYYITGTKGEPKKIVLDRSLVTFEN